MKVRFTALSISSTHMKMMIAFRRVSTPTTPIVNSTALKKRASVSTLTLLALPEHDRAHDRGEQEDARHLEGQQIILEQRTSQWSDGAVASHHVGHRVLPQGQRFGQPHPRERGDLRKERESHEPGRQLPPD